MLDELLTEFSSSILTKELNKMKESDPEKYDQTLKMTLAVTEVGIHFLQESPKFRQAFARIHNEFLKCPESKSTIELAIESGHKFGEN